MRSLSDAMLTVEDLGNPGKSYHCGKDSTRKSFKNTKLSDKEIIDKRFQEYNNDKGFITIEIGLLEFKESVICEAYYLSTEFAILSGLTGGKQIKKECSWLPDKEKVFISYATEKLLWVTIKSLFLHFVYKNIFVSVQYVVNNENDLEQSVSYLLFLGNTLFNKLIELEY